MTTDEENCDICLKLLGWRRVDGGWIKGDGFMFGGCGTPDFADWASAGLIADAFADKGIEFDILYAPTEKHWEASTWINHGMPVDEHASSGPLAIRAAALEYIRSRS